MSTRITDVPGTLRRGWSGSNENQPIAGLLCRARGGLTSTVQPLCSCRAGGRHPQVTDRPRPKKLCDSELCFSGLVAEFPWAPGPLSVKRGHGNTWPWVPWGQEAQGSPQRRPSSVFLEVLTFLYTSSDSHPHPSLRATWLGSLDHQWGWGKGKARAGVS